eukprot:3242961-Rhodomonas_salina.1
MLLSKATRSAGVWVGAGDPRAGWREIGSSLEAKLQDQRPTNLLSVPKQRHQPDGSACFNNGMDRRAPFTIELESGFSFG